MKNNIFKSLVGVALCVTLFSFSKIGGDSYTIHLNNKQLLQYYVHSKAATPTFSLAQSNGTDQLSVFYSECGKIGKERKLSLLDEKDNTLAEWRFANAPADEHTPMTCKAKEILAFKQKNSKVKLFYSSNEVSRRQLLATITLSDDVKASR
jgi:hypothetical protein